MQFSIDENNMIISIFGRKETQCLIQHLKKSFDINVFMSGNQILNKFQICAMDPAKHSLSCGSSAAPRELYSFLLISGP